MPYPRRVIIYLRERRIPESLVKVVRVSDPGDGDMVLDPKFPPRPAGSLPILAIPSKTNNEKNGPAKESLYIRQSMAIIYFLEEICAKGMYSFPHSPGIMSKDIVERARMNEVLSLAEECTIGW